MFRSLHDVCFRTNSKKISIERIYVQTLVNKDFTHILYLTQLSSKICI